MNAGGGLGFFCHVALLGAGFRRVRLKRASRGFGLGRGWGGSGFGMEARGGLGLVGGVVDRDHGMKPTARARSTTLTTGYRLDAGGAGPCAGSRAVSGSSPASPEVRRGWWTTLTGGAGWRSFPRGARGDSRSGLSGIVERGREREVEVAPVSVVEEGVRTTSAPQVVLAVLASIGALYLLKPILVPITLALMLACLLSPVTTAIRRALPVGPMGAAVLLFVFMAIVGAYIFIMTANSLFQAATSLPAQFDWMTQKISERVAELYNAKPYLRGVLPDPDALTRFGQTNATLLSNLQNRLGDLTAWVAQGLVILTIVLFLLAESEMLTPKLVRFFTPIRRDAILAERMIHNLVHQIRTFLVARTLINMGLGVFMALVYWWQGLQFAVALGLFIALCNFIPYIGPVLGGIPPVLVLLAQEGTVGDALIITAIYVAATSIEGNVITPLAIGRSLDLNGTTVLIACLFWWFIWGPIGLLLAMPITSAMKVVFQNAPSLQPWAELMSIHWHRPGAGVGGGASSSGGIPGGAAEGSIDSGEEPDEADEDLARRLGEAGGDSRGSEGGAVTVTVSGGGASGVSAGGDGGSAGGSAGTGSGRG